MSQQTIIWNQRVLGRDIGDVETLETDTTLMQNLLAMGRASVITVEDIEDPKSDDEAPAKSPKAKVVDAPVVEDVQEA